MENDIYVPHYFDAPIKTTKVYFIVEKNLRSGRIERQDVQEIFSSIEEAKTELMLQYTQVFDSANTEQLNKIESFISGEYEIYVDSDDIEIELD